MNYYVDYFDYYLSGLRAGYRLETGNRSKRLLFDLLCIDPKHDVFIFTLTETLLEDSNNILIQYTDFWKFGVFKIAMAPKYKSVNKYINDRLNILNNSPDISDNFELKIYESDIPEAFLQSFLVNELGLKGKSSFIIHRQLDADTINRHLLIEKISNLDYMNEGLGSLICASDIDKINTILYDRARNRSLLFQRSYILEDLYKQYPALNYNRSFLTKMFDNNYNDAMAQAVKAVRLSQIKSRLSSVSLECFILCLDKTLYKELSSLTPHQLYLLILTDDWQMYIEYISSLYSLLYNNKLGSEEMYYYFKKYYLRRAYAFDFIFEIMSKIISSVNYPEIFWKSDLQRGKDIAKSMLRQRNSISDQMCTYAAEISTRTPGILITIRNIKNRNE